MSKRAQQNQSAFDRGNKIGIYIAKTWGKVETSLYNAHFRNLYRGAKRWHSVVRKASRIGYNNTLDKAAEAAQAKTDTTHLTGGQDAQL